MSDSAYRQRWSHLFAAAPSSTPARSRWGRRTFMRVLSGLLLIVGTGSACDGDDPIIVGETGTVRVTIDGFVTTVSNAGTVLITGTNINQIELTLPTASGDTTVPVGTYHVVYTPPAGYAMAPGQSNELDVTVEKDEITDVALTVVQASGVLRLSVTGLGGAAPNGGSAQVLRTDIAGQAPQAVNVPLAGTVDVTLVNGQYSVTYSPPSGHELTGAETNPKSVVVGDGITPVSFAVQVVVAPVDIAFHSDWSTALGSSQSALLDASKPLPWDMKGGNGSLNEIVPNTAALGFPTSMANVFRNVAQFSGNAGQTVLTDQLRLTHTLNHIPIPDPGESLYYRWYVRYVVPDAIDPDGGTPHPVQDGPAASQQNWMWETPILQNGTWIPQFNFAGANDFPNNRWASPPLQKNVTYRVEFRLERISETQFVPEIRIFSGDTQVQGNSNFVNRDGSLSFADSRS